MKRPIHLVNGLLYRSSRPDSVTDLMRAEISAVICLQSGMYELLTDDAYENGAAALAHFNIDRFDIHCSDFTPPSREQVRSALDIIERYRRAGRRVLLHCLSGVDRTGYITAAYRIVEQGWTYEKARAEYIAEGQHWWYRWWIPSLKKYCKEHA